MSIRSRFLSALVAIAVITGVVSQVASCGFDREGTRAPEQATPCVNDSNCDDGNPCTTDTCLADGTCEQTNVADGPLSTQTAGDCLRSDCLAGQVIQTNDDADINDDDEPCTTDSCSNGNPVNTPLADDTACSMGVTPGRCVAGVCTIECGPDKPCDDLNPCTEDSCNAGAGTCTFVPLDGLPTPGTAQTVGDCKQQICVNGVDTAINDDGDVPDDSNPCTQNVCVDGMPDNPGASAGTPCFIGQPQVCDGQGACVECNVAADCVLLPPNDDCQARSCVNHVCGQIFTPTGTPLKQQTAGDCKQVVCNGSGGTIVEDLDTDVFEDNNPCTKNLCNAGIPSNPNEPQDTVCGMDLVCNATGTCVGCNLPEQCAGVDDFCKKRTCINQQCGFDFTAAGTDLANGQTSQDCKVVECDGQGNIVTSVDQNDKPIDGNQCTQDVCSAQGTPSNPFEAVSFPCNQSGGTVCNGAGACKKIDGATCTAAGDCLSGNCVDGVCCDTACATTCKACNVPGNVGKCSNVLKASEDLPACAGVNSCDGAGTCRKDDGQSCSNVADCVSGFCIDGVCCASACNAACRACNVMGSVGACTPITSGEDNNPADVCSGTRACDSSGTCKTKDGATCANGSECLSGQCFDGVCCNVACSGTCQACNLAGTVGICSNVAAGQDDANGVPACSGANQSCDGMGTCKKENAQACAANAECLSGFCVDGVCCSGACTGNCQACNLTGSIGTCTNVAAGQDDAGTCSGATQSCDGSGACKSEPGVVCSVNANCLSNFCVDGICCNTACTGTCQACSATAKGQGVDGACGPIITGTDPDNECMNGSCNGASQCKLDQGNACVANDDCLSSHCVDGFCCNAACTGTCEACSATLKGQGTNGTCGPIVVNTDPQNECTPGSCNGTGLCKGDLGNSCSVNGDCLSGFCVDGVCCSSACTDTCKSCNVMGSVGTCSNLPANQDDPGTCVGTNQSCDGTGICKLENGQTCAMNAQCLSGHCVDGVCCDTACTGLCQACSAVKTGGTNGTCGNVMTGTDPDDECATEMVSTCGTTGVCSGMGTCQLHASGTMCVAQSCTSSTQQNADTCNGLGMCIDNGTTDCSPYVCGATACKTSCTLDGDCVSTHYCSGTTCVPKKANGDACLGSNECASTHCADGVCCDTACSGLCEACIAASTGGVNGTCGAITAGTDPDDECATEPVATCGQNGFCNGAGACERHASGTTCVAQSCTGSTQQNADTCDGQGVCIDKATTDCAPYVCNATACKTSCTVDSDCVSTHYCSGNLCVVKLPNGAVCTGTNQCASNHCADGVCCDTACTDTCNACTTMLKGQGTDGTCGPINVGTDPQDECPNGACGGDGSCKSDLGQTCSSGADCLSGFCADGVCCDTACSGTCNACSATLKGQGTDGTCGTIKLGDDPENECTNGACDGTGSCKFDNGQTCATGTDCLSAFCVDDICCDTSCSGTCEACSAVKKGIGVDGVCDPVTAGFDPDDDCADQGVATCGTNGVCNGSGACEMYVVGSICTPATCSMDTQSNADTCDGMGTCVDNGTVPCSPYTCGAIACLTMCTGDSDCLAGFYCSAGTCVAQEANGTTCTTTTECLSGFCVDGVCCNNECLDICNACTADKKSSGLHGICGVIEMGTDPDDECPGAATCTGGNSCP